jgi:hypothetical protein
MSPRQQQSLEDWQKRSPIVSWRGVKTQADFAKMIGLKNYQLLQHWERGVIVSEGGIKECFPPTKWLRAMIRAAVPVDFNELHEWFESRPKIRV